MQQYLWILFKVKEIALSKVEELQEELDARVKERNQHGRTFDEIDLCDMEEQCKIVGMSNVLSSNVYWDANYAFLSISIIQIISVFVFRCPSSNQIISRFDDCNSSIFSSKFSIVEP